MTNTEFIAKYGRRSGWKKFTAETAPGFYWFRHEFTGAIQPVVVHSGYIDDGTDHTHPDHWDGEVMPIPKWPEERDT